MRLFRRKKEVREEQVIDESVISDPILRALLADEEINRDVIMNIPSVSACVNKIADTVSMIDIKLYKRDGDKIEEVKDYRTKLLNDETGDTFDGSQWKKAMVTDMYLGRGGYTYVNKESGEIKSIHYVKCENVGFWSNADQIYKDYKIQVNGRSYEGWQFIKLLRNTRNGYYGNSILDECRTILAVVYAAQLFEKNLVKTGGNKKGFIQSERKLSKEAMANLKEAFRNLYCNNSENVVVLNEGLSFKESSNSSVELQLNQNKMTNNDDICKIFLVPPTIINGNSTEEDREQFNQECIMPILNRFAKAINAVMLEEAEKDTYFFAFDTTELLKGDLEKRFNAYKTALDAGFMQLDEVRKKEKMPAFDLEFVKLGLQDVLYFPKDKQIYTPNTNKLSVMGKELTQSVQGGEEEK